MTELTRIQREIKRLKAQEVKAGRLGRAKGQLRELKYGKYLKPGRKVAAWGKKKYVEAREKGMFDTSNFDMGGGLDMSSPFGSGGSGPLADIGGVSMGNPFGEPSRRTTRHRRKPKRRTQTRRRRPQYIIVRR